MNIPITTVLSVAIASVVVAVAYQLYHRRRAAKLGRERYLKALDLSLTHPAGELQLLRAAAVERRAATTSNAMRERANEECTLYALAIEMKMSGQPKAAIP
jgi:hypothetical protein